MKKCKNGQHSLIEILRTIWDYIGEVDAVVKWCEYCGAIVIDEEFDGRTKIGSIRKMEFPEIMRLLIRRGKK